MARLKPLIITAYLQQGIVIDTLYGTSLDGILASVIRENQKQDQSNQTQTLITGSLLDGGLKTPNPQTIELPLTKCFPQNAPEQWHWMCTTAQPINHQNQPINPEPDVHYHHCKPREHLTGSTVTRVPATISINSGRYRRRRLPVVSTPAYAVTWNAVGDPEKLEKLLRPIHSIGKRRRTGEGFIHSWKIETISTPNLFTHGHCHLNGKIGRTTPVECATKLNLDTTKIVTAGIRPPYWHPANQHQLITPNLTEK